MKYPMSTRRKTTSSSTEAWVLLVELRDIEPRIWREFIVPANITLRRLHQTLQIIMGWSDIHMHEFVIDEVRYGMADSDLTGVPIRSEQRVRLRTALQRGQVFEYLYDFGDGWSHRITRTRVLESCPDPFPWCIDGENACPPEDVGGPPGYADFIDAMKDENHPEHQNVLRWHGDRFDPCAFDTTKINLRLELGN